MKTQVWYALLVMASSLALTSCRPGVPGGNLLPGVQITSEGNKTYVSANISGLEIARYPELQKIHALFTVYYDGEEGANDAKLMALAQLRFTNLACVVFTDCPLVTDKGIEYVSQISTVTNLGLRGMSITDEACATMASKIRLGVVFMPGCPNVTVKGLVRMAQSKSIEQLGFTVGKMSQDDLLEIINAAGPKLNRLDIDWNVAAEKRLDLPALRQAAEAKSITLVAPRNGVWGKL